MTTIARPNEEIVRRFFDAWNEADFAVIDEIVAADATHHGPVDRSDELGLLQRLGAAPEQPDV